MVKPIEHPDARFAKRVQVDQQTGCHLWQGTPVIFVHGRGTVAALRYACEKAWDVLPARTLRLICNSPTCVNAAHAEVIPKGEGGARTLRSMTPEMVDRIRELAADGLTAKVIAREVGLEKPNYIYRIVSLRAHKRWRVTI